MHILFHSNKWTTAKKRSIYLIRIQCQQFKRQWQFHDMVGINGEICFCLSAKLTISYHTYECRIILHLTVTLFFTLHLAEQFDCMFFMNFMRKLRVINESWNLSYSNGMFSFFYNIQRKSRKKKYNSKIRYTFSQWKELTEKKVNKKKWYRKKRDRIEWSVCCEINAKSAFETPSSDLCAYKQQYTIQTAPIHSSERSTHTQYDFVFRSLWCMNLRSFALCYDTHAKRSEVNSHGARVYWFYLPK